MIKPALLRNSPDRAFESLYRRHVKDVYRYVLAMLDRQADAEDATQTTFLNAYRALERGERPRDAGKWLRAIALNVCREHYRRAGRRPDEISLDDDPGDLVLDPATPEIGDLIRGLSCLPFNQRAALVMREFEGRSLAEIATALEVSSSAVETLLFRARRALREQLEGTLTCSDAEQAISRQLDGALPRAERGPLRAHLRECSECAALARRLRAQRGAMRSLAAAIPLPASLQLSRLLGGGAAAPTIAAGSSTAGGSLLAAVGAKVAALAVAGVAVVSVGYASLHRHHTAANRPHHQPGAMATTGSRTASIALQASSQAGSSPVAPRGRNTTAARHVRGGSTAVAQGHRVAGTAQSTGTPGSGSGQRGTSAGRAKANGAAPREKSSSASHAKHPRTGGRAHGGGGGSAHTKPKHSRPPASAKPKPTHAAGQPAIPAGSQGAGRARKS